MKKDFPNSLILVRHAKSSWDDVHLPDFERPLNKRGKKDAPKMAKKLKHKKIKIDAFISSPATRAKKTAEVFAEEYDRDVREIILVDGLYHASIEDFYNAVKNTENKFKCIAVFSHNPGISAFANDLVPNAKIDDMPTCSVFAVKVNTSDWSEFKDATKEFLFFDYPKKEKEE
jgi:phosphohistidine phosphatase